MQLSGGLPGCPWFFQAAAAASRCQHVNCTVYGDTKHLRHYWCHWATAKAFTTSRRRSSGTWNNLLPPSQGLPRRGFGLVRLEVRLCTSPTVWCWKSLFVDLPYLFLRYPAKYWRRVQYVYSVGKKKKKQGNSSSGVRRPSALLLVIQVIPLCVCSYSSLAPCGPEPRILGFD